ncbi:exosortase V [Sphingomonas sp. KR1UV-12]|uniref:Exosortase V n=1 Tax=Sphingomonas aurea TaxID=3063994 RepID=A0ABT9EJL0_9SPHN|nr:exosortase V [Sphingomonas sp. KR1UV-12]MDP1027150.1 exosortase V [Sphingomonas sp. KR1UV-12]
MSSSNSTPEPDWPASPANGPAPNGTAAAEGTSPRNPWLVTAESAWAAFRRAPIFWLGIAALAAPTLIDLAARGWGTDQAAHAPIVFATAIWLFALSAKQAAAAMQAPPAWRAVVALAPGLILYAAARITGLLEVRGLAAYLSLVAVLYAVGGKRVLAVLWFPILYSLFLIPIPDTLVDIATQPVKLYISKTVVGLLGALGYPVATSGVSIYIGQFELLIAAACAGLNSLISLTAIGSFYVYLRHNASWRYTLLLVALIFPIAVFANFLRVLILVLLTYYAGEAVAQGFLHEAAGLFMFVAAVLTIFLIDKIFTVIGQRMGWMTA